MTASRDDADGNDRGGGRRFGGRQVVIALYLILTAVGGGAGVLVATFVDDLSAPALYGVIPLPPTALGFGVYGAVTLATVLGIPLALVAYVSRRIDDPDAIEE